MARPRKGKEPVWKEAFLEALVEHPNVKLASQRVGISRMTAYRAYKKAEADDTDNFNELWDEAMEAGIDQYELDLYDVATGKIRGGNVTGLIYLLNVRRYQKRTGTDTPSKLTLEWGSSPLT